MDEVCVAVTPRGREKRRRREESEKVRDRQRKGEADKICEREVDKKFVKKEKAMFYLYRRCIGVLKRESCEANLFRVNRNASRAPRERKMMETN